MKTSGIFRPEKIGSRLVPFLPHGNLACTGHCRELQAGQPRNNTKLKIQEELRATFVEKWDAGPG